MRGWLPVLLPTACIPAGPFAAILTDDPASCAPVANLPATLPASPSLQG